MDKKILKKNLKSQEKKAKEKLWNLCKKIIRKRDENICIPCGRICEGSGQHTGHFIPSSTCGAYLRYDLRNLHSSCYNCNINLGGNGAMFYKALAIKYSEAFVEKIFLDKNIIIKADILFYEKKIKEYEEISDWDKDKLLDHTRRI